MTSGFDSTGYQIQRDRGVRDPMESDSMGHETLRKDFQIRLPMWKLYFFTAEFPSEPDFHSSLRFNLQTAEIQTAIDVQSDSKQRTIGFKLRTRKLQSSFDLDYSTTLFNRYLNWLSLYKYVYSLTLFRSYYFWSFKNKSTENLLHWSRKFTAFISWRQCVNSSNLDIHISINSTVLYIFLALELTSYRVEESSTETTLIQHI
jgi:hypothetical protein